MIIDKAAADIIAGMQRIEAKLQQLIDALAGDEAANDPDDGAVRSLDGSSVTFPRIDNESLG